MFIFFVCTCVYLCVCVCVCVYKVPDAPKYFEIVKRALDTIHLQWDKPLEPNGVLIGYQLKYHTGGLRSNNPGELGMLLKSTSLSSSTRAPKC